jgi:hypothetical protein
MSFTVPADQARDLTEDQAARLWNWTLRRHGLAPDTRFTGLTDLADTALGLHAARLPSPFATALARAATPGVAEGLFAEAGRSLVTVRCVRKTLHTLPHCLAAVAHAATRHYRERDAHRAITNAGITSAAITEALDAVLGVVDGGPLHHRVIEKRLAGPRRPVPVIRLALKLGWERGELTYRNISACWNREHRTFAATHRQHPDLDMDIDRPAATAALVSTYFDRYGPATLRDVMWWSALSRTAITSVMAADPRPWVRLGVAAWGASDLYMYRDQWEHFTDSSPSQHRSGVNFLAHEDVALKAYAETRTRYLGDLPTPVAFNQIGEAYPCVLVDGRVVGTWAWVDPTRPLRLTLAPGRTTPEEHALITRGAVELAASLRRNWAAGPHVPDQQLALVF